LPVLRQTMLDGGPNPFVPSGGSSSTGGSSSSGSGRVLRERDEGRKGFIRTILYSLAHTCS